MHQGLGNNLDRIYNLYCQLKIVKVAYLWHGPGGLVRVDCFEWVPLSASIAQWKSFS